MMFAPFYPLSFQCPVPAPVPPARTFCDVGVQTEAQEPAVPSANALRMRAYRKLRKEREERVMHAQLALKRARQCPTLLPQREVVLPQRGIVRVEFSNRGCEGASCARLVSIGPGEWQVQQIRASKDVDLHAGDKTLSDRITGLLKATRLRTQGHNKYYPTSLAPEYSIPLKNHDWRQNALMTEDIWSGSPSHF
eukprot:6195924-Pleurochrysis_carterae.AAC.1